MSNTIRKRRRIVNGVEITLLEKNTETLPLVDSTLVYSNIESRLKSYLTEQLSKVTIPQSVQTIIQQEVQSAKSLLTEPLFVSSGLTAGDIISTVSNIPEDGSIMTYDSQGKSLLWKQSPTVRFDIIDNTILNYANEFSSDHILSNKFHLPFAVAWGKNNWGGPGRGGIFWLDPWDQPVDNFSIKMGRNNTSINESGYDYGSVHGLAMKFSNGPEIDYPITAVGQTIGHRGFVWNSHNNHPVMALDTSSSGLGVSRYSKGGRLTTHGGVETEGNLYLSGNQKNNISYGQECDFHGYIHINDATIGNNIFTLPNFGAGYNGYVLTYTQLDDPSGVLFGTIKLKPPTGGGGGGGTFPSVEIDGGSFLQIDQYAKIDGGSFI